MSKHSKPVWNQPAWLLLVLFSFLSVGCAQLPRMKQLARASDARPIYQPVYEDVASGDDADSAQQSRQSRRDRITDKLICAGCGDVYWSDWYNHPPSEKDQLGGNKRIRMSSDPVCSTPTPLYAP